MVFSEEVTELHPLACDEQLLHHQLLPHHLHLLLEHLHLPRYPLCTELLLKDEEALLELPPLEVEELLEGGLEGGTVTAEGREGTGGVLGN